MHLKVIVTPRKVTGLHLNKFAVRRDAHNADELQREIGWAVMDAISKVRKEGINLAGVTYTVAFEEVL